MATKARQTKLTRQRLTPDQKTTKYFTIQAVIIPI